jgi:hypothetical protein
MPYDFVNVNNCYDFWVLTSVSTSTLDSQEPVTNDSNVNILTPTVKSSNLYCDVNQVCFQLTSLIAKIKEIFI